MSRSAAQQNGNMLIRPSLILATGLIVWVLLAFVGTAHSRGAQTKQTDVWWILDFALRDSHIKQHVIQHGYRGKDFLSKEKVSSIIEEHSSKRHKSSYYFDGFIKEVQNRYTALVVHPIGLPDDILPVTAAISAISRLAKELSRQHAELFGALADRVDLLIDIRVPPGALKDLSRTPAFSAMRNELYQKHKIRLETQELDGRDIPFDEIEAIEKSIAIAEIYDLMNPKVAVETPAGATFESPGAKSYGLIPVLPGALPKNFFSEDLLTGLEAKYGGQGKISDVLKKALKRLKRELKYSSRALDYHDNTAKYINLLAALIINHPDAEDADRYKAEIMGRAVSIVGDKLIDMYKGNRAFIGDVRSGNVFLLNIALNVTSDVVKIVIRGDTDDIPLEEKVQEVAKIYVKHSSEAMIESLLMWAPEVYIAYKLAVLAKAYLDLLDEEEIRKIKERMRIRSNPYIPVDHVQWIPVQHMMERIEKKKRYIAWRNKTREWIAIYNRQK